MARGRGVLRGRPRALPADVLADLASTACRIGTRVPISSAVVAVVFEAQLKALGDPPTVERSAREFLSKLGLSYRRKSITTKTDTAEEAGEAVKNVRETLTFIMNLHDIDASRIINEDETSVRMVPLGDRGWADADTSKWLGD